MRKYLSLIFALLLLTSCSEKEEVVEQMYTGPSAVAFDINTLYTEFGNTKIKLKAPEQSQFQNGDREFAKGLLLLFYKTEHTGKPYADLVADFAHYYAGPKHWKLVGNVVYRDIEEKKVLRAEVLFWNPETKRLWSEDFVHITAPGKELMGDGLEALDDFSWYKIKQPRGRKKNI